MQCTRGQYDQLPSSRSGIAATGEAVTVMSDDRFTFLHARDDVVSYLLDSANDDKLPEEDVDIPPGTLPPYQDEADDSALPTNTHPSYPYGNPYRATSGSRLALPFPHAHARSLASNLSSIYLARLGGAQPSANWTDLGLDELLPYQEPEEPPGMPGGVNEHSGATGEDEDGAGGNGEGDQTTSQNGGSDEGSTDLSDNE